MVVAKVSKSPPKAPTLPEPWQVEKADTCANVLEHVHMYIYIYDTYICISYMHIYIYVDRYMCIYIYMYM